MSKQISQNRNFVYHIRLAPIEPSADCHQSVFWFAGQLENTHQSAERNAGADTDTEQQLNKQYNHFTAA